MFEVRHSAVSEKKKILNFNPIALRKAKTVYNFGLSECNRVKFVLFKNNKDYQK